MTKILTAFSLAALSFSVTACGSAGSPVSPTSVANIPAGTDDRNPPASARPNSAPAAKPGSLTIVGIVTEDDREFDVLQAAVIRTGVATGFDGAVG